MAKKVIYRFGGGSAEGRAEMKALLGGKGANLAEMANIGIPVPPGFTITTEVCNEYYKNGGKYPAGLKDEVKKSLAWVEKQIGMKYGDAKNPLLMSVRSGARASMPGMMDTVLNIGLNEKTLPGLIAKSGDERFANDSYRRFIQMYSNVVMGIDKDKEKEKGKGILEQELDRLKESKGYKGDLDLKIDDLKTLVKKYKELVKKHTNKNFPDDPWEQLWGAIGAVFESWNKPSAVTYRKLNKIPESWGTAVNVQSMVFGNLGPTSATGVAFTRDPSTGEDFFYGEFLPNAQGEDVVAGIRTPLPINDVRKHDPALVSLEKSMPSLYKELDGIEKKLERHYRDMMDIEFTIQEGKLWMLQCRVGKRTAFASLKIAVDMVREGLISKKEALLRMEPEQITHLLAPIFKDKDKLEAKKEGRILAKGLNASPGAACGRISFDADEAEAMAKDGEKVLLVRSSTSPEDIHGMNAAQGILTAEGGMTSHAAVVARGMGKPCVAGCKAIEINYSTGQFKAGGVIVKKGDYLSIDGTTGEVINGKMNTYPSEIAQVVVDGTIKPEKSKLYQQFALFLKWADEVRRLRVRTNADTPRDARIARNFGAEGIGLTRTEHMFFEADRIMAVREMILADDEAGRRKALKKILPFQKKDFLGILKAMEGLPVTIRLLDPPLHEFLPTRDKEINELAAMMKVTPERLRHKIDSLHEFNPMLGHRGCRLGITYPEIYEIQVRAIFEAACELTKKGVKVHPEVMIPVVAHINEFKPLEELTRKVAAEIMARTKTKVKYYVGTMIELPRAALTADEIATAAEFFSFGTNDLTQTTLGVSRDDAGSFLREYVEKKILPFDPFVSIDREGVGQLIKMAAEKGRRVRKDIHIGICGEHGGDPDSVIFCHDIGLDYVSCSPYRVPIARLAAAHAVLREDAAKKAAKQGKKAEVGLATTV